MTKEKDRSLTERYNDGLKSFRLLPPPGPGWVGGVCAGIAYHFGLPTWIVRLAWAIAVFCYGVGGVLYLLLWIFVPNYSGTLSGSTPKDYTARTGDPDS